MLAVLLSMLLHHPSILTLDFVPVAHDPEEEGLDFTGARPWVALQGQGAHGSQVQKDAGMQRPQGIAVQKELLQAGQRFQHLWGQLAKLVGPHVENH